MDTVNDQLNPFSEFFYLSINSGCSKTVDDGDLSAKTLVKYKHPVVCSSRNGCSLVM